jgi:hypothetical protein
MIYVSRSNENVIIKAFGGKINGRAAPTEKLPP